MTSLIRSVSGLFRIDGDSCNEVLVEDAGSDRKLETC